MNPENEGGAQERRAPRDRVAVPPVDAARARGEDPGDGALMPRREPTFSALPAHGTLLSWDEFFDDVQDGMLEDDDGYGHLATATQVSDVDVMPSDLGCFARPAWATHVCWYNC